MTYCKINDHKFEILSGGDWNPYGGEKPLYMKCDTCQLIVPGNEALQFIQIKVIKNLNQKIDEFSNTTSNISEKANKLIFWYVILTGVIATSTILTLFF